jgi:hypothetical protein
MSLFLVFAICGFLEAWALLMMWGFSAGPTNAVPFVTLVGALILLLISAPLALFIPRLSSAIAILASTLLLVWPAAIVISDSDPSGLLFAIPPVIAATVAAWRVWRTRHSKWLAFAARPALWLRVILAAVPAVVFCLVFNAPLVLALLLSGPPG